MIHLTIDGIPAEVEKGTTILQAARQIGVEIPTLCYLENVLPDGSCRLCVVEVTNNGRTKYGMYTSLFRRRRSTDNVREGSCIS